jgi:hypothetical protein
VVKVCARTAIAVAAHSTRTAYARWLDLSLLNALTIRFIDLLLVTTIGSSREAGVYNAQAFSEFPAVLVTKRVADVQPARSSLRNGDFNTDSLTLYRWLRGHVVLHFDIREILPDVVFVLYSDRTIAERLRGEFY